MTNEQIIKQAVEKAIKNGYPKPPEFDKWNWKYVYENSGYWEIIFSHVFAKAFWGEVIETKYYTCHRCSDRDLYLPTFADKKEFDRFHKEAIKKDALYGNPLHDWSGFNVDSHNSVKQGCQWQLQQMVLQKEPIKYLANFL